MDMGAKAPSVEPSSPFPPSSGVLRLGQHDDGDLREGYQARAQEPEPHLHCAGDRWFCWRGGPPARILGVGGQEGGNITSVLNLHPAQQGAPQDCSRPVSSPPPGELQCAVDGWNACQIQASSASWASSHTCGPSPWCWPLPHLPQGFDFALFVHLFPHSTNI